MGGIQKGELFSIRSLEAMQTLMELLGKLKQVSDGSPTALEEALGLSYIIQIFCLLNRKDCQPTRQATSMPENILALQQYIDQNFQQITSVEQVAEHFFYSREYVSRLFRKHFDTTISDYLMKRRIVESQSLILQGLPMIEVAGQAGFRSLPTFIRAFRAVTNMTPSEYRKRHRDKG